MEQAGAGAPTTQIFHGLERASSQAAALDRLARMTVHVHPDDEAALARTRALGLASREGHRLLYRVRRAGAWRRVEERLAPLDAPGGGWGCSICEIAEPASHADELQAAVMDIGVGIWTIDLSSGVWFWSPQFRHILGLSEEAPASDAAFRATIDPEDHAALGESGDGPGLPRGCYRVRIASRGEVRWVEVSSRLVADPDEKPLRVVGTLRDVTDRRCAELEREASELRLEAALRIGRMVVWDLDVASGIVTRSANALEMLGNRREPIAEFAERVHPADRRKLTWESSDSPIPPSGEIQFRYDHPNGTQLHLQTSAIKLPEANAQGHVVGITADITARKVSEMKLMYAADHDMLTGLLSRKGWTQRLERAVAAAARKGGTLHLILLDVDLFKTINDSLGHDAGDQVLATIGTRLRAMPSTIEFAARLGGDEFAVVVRAGPDIDPLAVGDAIVAMAAEPVTFGDQRIQPSGSCGIASFPDHARTAEDLVKNADLALYAAKQAGRGRAHAFEPAMRVALDGRIALDRAFRDALSAGQVVPYYQPKLDLETGLLVGFEALARWQHVERGLLTPCAFESVFEDGPLAIALASAIRTAVFADLRSWLDRGLSVGRIAVNCSGHEFRGGGMADLVLEDLARFGLSPHHLELEVTEGVMVGRDADLVARTLETLHAAGIKISLDDFGTGYASLVHLRQFPVDEIKIDRSFVADVDREANPAIIRAVLAMGQSLGLTTVAEGVERPEQAEILYAMGCRQAQGYLISRPMSAGRVPWFVENGLAPFRPAPRAPVRRRLRRA